MFPQTELDNYKLQVELLQEKLKRSEERREQLENKFDNIMKKKSENEKTSRSRSRAKYQQFLEEQRQRNERNKSLVRMLEEVDQRASLLASRSERLKMLKVQYELYFSRMIQSQCLRSIQPSPSGYSAISGDRLIQSSVHNPQVNEEICQSSNNFIKGTYLPQNWGMIANTLNIPSMGNDFNNIPGFGTYRFPSNTDFLNTMNGPILSHQGTQRQVNLKSTFGDSIASSHGFPNQMEMFADTRNPIDLDHYKIADVNMVMPHGEGDGGGGTGVGVGGINADMNTSSTGRVNNPIRSDKHYKNLNESSEGPSQMNSDNKTVFTRPGYNQRQVESERTQYKVSTSDKLQPINQEETPERAVVVEVNDNDKIDKKEDEGEKSQPINTFQQQEKISKEETGNGSFRTPSQTKQLQLNIPSMKNEMSEDMVLKNVNPISFNKPKAPVLWNFNGKIDPNQLPHPLQLGKKEKLSIENIENAIYGERISPTNTRKDEIVAQEQVLGIFEPDDLKSKTQSIPELKKEPNNIQYIKEPIQINENNSPEIQPLSEPIENLPTITQVGSNDLQNAQPVDAIIQPLPQQLNPVTEQEQSYDNATYPDQKAEMENTIQDINQPAAYENYEHQQPVEYSNAQYLEGEPQQNLYQNQSGENYQQPDVIENQNTYQGSESYQYPDQQNYPQNNDYSNAEYQTGDYQQDEYQQQDYQVQPGYEQQAYEDPSNYNYAYDQSYGQDPSYQQTEQQQPSDQYPESYDQQAYPVEAYQQEYANTEYQPSETISANGSGSSLNTTEEPHSATSALENVNLEPKRNQNNDEENEDEDEDDEENTNKNPMPEEKEATDDEEHVILPLPPVPSVMPPSILSTEKSADSPNGVKKKKKVNFIDSETEDTSTSAPKVAEVNIAAANDESDFDFSTASNSN